MEDMSKKRKQVDLAKQINVAFSKSGLTRFMLAKRAGVSYAIVHRFISDDRGITLDTASKLCETLGLELGAVEAKRRNAK